MRLSSSPAGQSASGGNELQNSRRKWSPGLREVVHLLQRQVELTDLILLLYLVVLLRQYCWTIQSNTLAWVVTVPGSALAWLFYLRIKGTVEGRTPGLFWVIVAIPLLLVYAKRVAFPDGSFDGLSYHVFHSERALHGELSIKGDFFPSYFPLLNPAPDMMTGIFRHPLGYRLGTVICVGGGRASPLFDEMDARLITLPCSAGPELLCDPLYFQVRLGRAPDDCR